VFDNIHTNPNHRDTSKRDRGELSEMTPVNDPGEKESTGVGTNGSDPDRSLTQRQREVLECVDDSIRNRGYPPSVREIGERVGLASPSTVHSHLRTLQKLGYLRRDPTKPRAIEVTADLGSGAHAERRPARHVPLVGDVAAGTGVFADEQVEELVPLPADFTGDGELFMLRVRGESMVDAGILDGDFVVARVQDVVRNGDTVVAGIPGEEATVKTYRRDGHEVILEPANEALQPMHFSASEVQVFGKVVTVLRKL
jgi:repressor LexA